MNDTVTPLPARRRRKEPAARPAPPGGLVLGTLCGFGPGGEPLVSFPGGPGGGPLPARSTTPLAPADLGAQVVLGFENGEPDRPLVVGRLWNPAPAPAPKAGGVDVQADGQRVVVSAEQEVVLRCGEASITLTRAGKIILRGTYLLSRSSGVNRIKGGSVQIN